MCTSSAEGKHKPCTRTSTPRISEPGMSNIRMMPASLPMYVLLVELTRLYSVSMETKRF